MAKKKKAELVAEAEALGVDVDGLKVPDLEVAVAAAEQATEAASEEQVVPEGKPDVLASVDEGMVRVTFGYWVESEFIEWERCVIDPDEAIALADTLPDAARAALNNRQLG